MIGGILIETLENGKIVMVTTSLSLSTPWHPFIHQMESSKTYRAMHDWMLTWLHTIDILQPSWQQCCQDACQILEQLDESNPISHGFEAFVSLSGKTFYNFVKRSPEVVDIITANQPHSGFRYIRLSISVYVPLPLAPGKLLKIHTAYFYDR